jgi:hypothetical protein
MKPTVDAPVRAIRRNSARIGAALAACDPSAALAALVRASPPLRVLGLDINTGSTGVAVLDERARVRHWGAVSTSQFASADVLAVGAAVDAALADVHASCGDRDGSGVEWLVGVEAFLRMFRAGRHHNAGMFQLAQLNGIVSFAAWQRFGVRPTHVHPSAARVFFGLSSARGAAIKQQALAFARLEQPAAAADALALGPRSGKWSDAAFDAADAYVVANYTRCQHFEARLLLSEPLRDAFAREYERLLRGGKTVSTEQRAMDVMGDDERRQHLARLLESGVRDWLRREYARVLSPAALREE